MPKIPWIVSFASIALLAQEPVGPVIRSTTRLVEVNVIARDKSGHPVVDLSKDDFQIAVDGKARQIAHFSQQRASTRIGPPPTKLPADVYTNIWNVREGSPTSVSIILLDNLNTNLQDQAFARQQIIQYLRGVQPGDRIAIYTLGRGFRVLHDFTTDASALVARMKQYQGENLPDLSASQPKVMSGGGDVVGWLGAGSSGPMADFFTRNRVAGTLRALQFISDHLAALPGRKNLVWVSGGFPAYLGFDNPAAWRNPARDRMSFSAEIDQAVRSMNNANLAIYPVDARGLVADPAFSAANRTIRNPGPNNPAMREVIRNQQTMAELADRTGGRAYYNTNDLNKAVHDAITDAEVTYTIAFYASDDQEAGKFRKIKVKLDRGGVDLRYRKGYYDLPPANDGKDRANQLRDAVWSPLDATAVPLVVKTSPNGQRAASIDLAVRVEPRRLDLQEAGERHQGKLDVLFVQIDDRGKQYSGASDTLDMNLKPETYKKMMQDGLIYTKKVQRQPQATKLRIIVRDANSGAMGSVTVQLAKMA